jgi:hypothetical protein
MKDAQGPFASLLDLIEDRIDQTDAFDPRDAQYLDKLLRCRERVKVAAYTADAGDRDAYVEVLQAGAYALGDPNLIHELLDPRLDV